jgi:hypothetical protein
VEFQDRLLFVKATHSDLSDGYPSVQRYGKRQFEPYPAQRDLKLSMELPEGIKPAQHVGKRRTRKLEDEGEESFTFPWQ